MVKTRSMKLKDQAQERASSSADGIQKDLVPKELFKTPFGSVKNEDQEHQDNKQEIPSETQSSKPSKSLKSKKSSSSSVMRKKLELQAAQEKARIQMELIDKKLEADIAALDEKYSSQPSESDHHSKGKDIEKWLEDSHQELEKQRANVPVKPHSSLCPPPEAVGTNGPVQELAHAIQQMITTTVSNTQPSDNVNLLSRISTPRDLPLFFGDPMEWLAFKQAYEESTLLCNFSERENLWRLRKCLRGAAKDAVSALLISATSPDNVMSTLELQFGNPDTILSRIMLDIKRLNPLPNEYYKDIVPFSIKIKNYVAAVRALRRDEYLQGVNVANIVLSKLPTVLLTKWTDYSYPLINEGQRSRLDILSDFLNLEAMKTSTCTASLMNNRVDNRRKYSDNYNEKTQTVLLQSATTETQNSAKEKCRFCRISVHKLTNCKKFKKSLRKDRWAYIKRVGICYKCLESRHDKNTCPAAACDVISGGQPCGLLHHRLLHYVPTACPSTALPPDTEQVINSENNELEPQPSAENEVVTHINSVSCSVLLKVTIVNIHGPNGVISAPALLDGGSTISMISSSLAERVGLTGRKQTLRVRGAWENTQLVCDSELVNVTLSNKHGKQYTISARSVNKLNIPVQNFTMVNLENYTYLHKVKHELICSGIIKPEVLIGQDNRHLLKAIEVLEAGLDLPCATLTPLGWCLHGRIPCSRTLRDTDFATTSFITEIPMEQDLELRDLHESVRRSFTIDSMGVSTSKPRQNMEDQRALDYLEQTSDLVDGKWHVGLPWKDPNCVMPDTRPMALMRLKGVENKMKKDSKYAQRFMERIQHLLENEYAEECKNCELTPKTWYLPIFGVDNPNKAKLRLVYDAAARYLGLSLNDYLLKGPDLLMSLFGIMLRFRENKIAVTGDIKDMFMRVKIRPEDRDAFRFLFRGNPTSPTTHENKRKNDIQNFTESKEVPIKTYVMSSLIFGANCSPFIAQFIKNKNARRFESTMPAATQAIITQHYMDDYIDSLPDEETAVNLTKEISYIHSKGNFEIRNWNSNSKVVLDSLPKETLGTAAVKFKLGQQHEGDRTLGLIWNTDDDSLGFDISFKKIPENIINGKQRPTKREILRVVMSIFDVYGFLSPFTINGKLILQETWQLNINWDDPITDEIYSKWKDWINILHSLRNVRLPRYYLAAATRASETESGPTSRPPHSHLQQTDPATKKLRTVAAAVDPPPSPAPTQPLQASDTAHKINCYRNLQMHIFCDSSTKAFCAVAYWRWIDNENNTRIAFIASKCRVAGIKPITIPRLELQAALLAARLANTITKEHKMTAERRYFWSDSTTVLHWIRNNARNYEIYVANRLGEIDELTQADEWRYIPTKMNVADLATRECFDRSMLQQEWLYGPTFLRNCENDWPHDVLTATNEPTTDCVTAIQNEDCTLPVPDPTKFSSWLRLRRTMMRVLEFIHKAKIATNSTLKNRNHNCDEHLMEKAERLLIKYSQFQSFGPEITLLKNSKTIPTCCKLLTLSPYLDEHGVLRADGRINAAEDVAPETKKPIILDGRDYITRLIVRHYHVTAAHGNQELVVNELKQKYWIIRLRPTVKNVVSKCMLCRLKKCKPEIPRIGDLPKARMAHHQRPFSFCGADLFGPMEVTVGRRHERRYGVLFTCLTVRAIHIEVVHNLTTDSFIMALRRMASRRGWPSHMFSDNGTNLRGADAELKKSINELDQQALTDEAFNSGNGTKWTFIPPVSPHWGGAWERLIRSVKTSLKVVLKERAPRDETLLTLLAEVENIVNSRPLTHVSVEIGSTESLTPNHFLIGSSSNLPRIGSFDDIDLYLRKQWRISQRLADMYWKRWVKEVLPDMIPRKKWNQENRPLQVGDMVVIVDSDGPRNTWPKGLIVEVNPGRDGRVRMVKVKTKIGFLTRSATRVARIPIGDECC